MASTINGPAEAADKALKAVLNIGVTGLESLMASVAPWTQLPVVRQLIDWSLDWAEENLYAILRRQGNVLIITFETVEERDNYVQATDDLKKAIAEGDPLKLQAARLAFNDASDKLIQSDGSARP